MNPIQQFNEANNCFYLDFTGGTFNESIGVTFSDNNIYKAKSNGVSNAVKNATTIFPATIDGRITNGASGYSRIFCNKSQVTGISINIGVTGQNEAKDARNIILDASFLKQFPKLKQFFFNHYAYSRNDASLTGKVTGDWATNLSPDIEILNLEAIDYPNSTATFNLNNIPAESKLKEVIFANFTSPVLNSYLTVDGDLSKIPASCNKLMLGGDRTSAGTNNVTGAIPAWVTFFSRIGRNTITGYFADLNDDIEYLNLGGSNRLDGNLKSLPKLSLINISGNNTLKGPVPNLPACTSFTIAGNNSLSGILDINNNLPNATVINIQGNNTLRGSIKTNPKITALTIYGNNEISEIESLPNCTTFDIRGMNTISDNIFPLLPKAVIVRLAGLNTIKTYVKHQFAAAGMVSISLTGNAELTGPMVDQLLTDLAAATWSNSSTAKSVTIRGKCSPPSQVGLDAIAILSNNMNKVTVLTN